ncbi:MAG: hypothetical protein ACKN9D_13750 [Actinomycetales bacterium]
MSSALNQPAVETPTTAIAGELPIATWEATGDPDVDGALTAMLGLGSLTLAEQAAVFDGIHRNLRERLVNAAPQSSDVESTPVNGLTSEPEAALEIESLAERDPTNSPG